MHRVFRAAPWFFLGMGLTLLSGCGADQAAGRALPRPVAAQALSKHYVEVTLGAAAGDDAASPEHYFITEADQAVLPVEAALVAADRRSVILTTGEQKPVQYRLTIGALTSGSAVPQPQLGDGDITFFGSAQLEPVVRSAISLSNTSVLLTFGTRMDRPSAQTRQFYRIAEPDLNITNATLAADDLSLVLTTSPQENIEYTVKATNVRSHLTLGFFYLDPTASTAMFHGIAPNDTTRPRLVSAVATSETRVLLSFSEPVSDNAGDPINYAIAPSLPVIAAELSAFKTQVALTTFPMTGGLPYTVTASNVRDRAVVLGNLIDPAFNSAVFMFDPLLIGGSEQGSSPPRMIGAISTSDTTVIVNFSKPMGDSADVADNYTITGSQTAFLFVIAALRSPDRTAVRLTTSPQSDDSYTVHAVGLKDVAGNPLASPDGIFALPTGFDPSKATFRGTPPSSIDLQIDTDGDGFADWFETAGWDIIVGLANGGTKLAFVTSDPYNPDTDGDGFTDGEENAHNWDPRTNDTDADIVDDYTEFNIWYSDPADQDSDNDGIDDLTEVTFYKTSPILTDTDGDGFDDDKELFELSRNPNVADLPRPNIIADNIRLQINEKYSFQDTEGNTQTTTSSTETTLTQSTETKFSTSDTDVLKVGVEASLEISATPSFTIGGNFGAEWTTQTTSESAQMAQQQYQNSISRAREISSTRQVTREITGASVSATVTIVNEGDIAFTIGDIEVSALQQGGPNRSRFLPVASLVPGGGNNTFNLGPLIPERGPFVFTNTDVFPTLVEDLMRSPRGLVLKVANFNMTDEFGRNFAFTSQEVNDKTSEVRIDFGDGRRSSFHVATYGGVDDQGFGGPPDGIVGGFNDLGGTAGIPLDFAMQGILGYVKNPPAFDAIVAGNDGFANTVAVGDDVQETPPATAGLDDRAIVVSAGENGILDTATPAGDDQKARTKGYDTSATCNETTIEKIIEPPNFGDGVASSVKPAVGSDDIQMIAAGMMVAPGATIIAAGPNGVLETVALGDDVRKGPGDPCTANGQCPGGLCNGREVVTRVENSINGDRNRFWVALTSDLLPVGTDVGQVNLQPGFVILLAFIQDIDRDGLSAQEEYMHGSSDRNKDTDGDLLGDFTEVRDGWVVDLLPNPYRAHPDPRLPDSDGDGKTDREESMARTDPRLLDTDLDGISDNNECDNMTGSSDPDKSLDAICMGFTRVPPSLNPLDRDSDDDGLNDGQEVELETCPLNVSDGPQFLDTDEDGLKNSDETTAHDITYVDCNGAMQTVSVQSDPTRGDTDFDGLPDLLEDVLGSNPQDVDTDGDSLLDYDEFASFALFRHLESEFPGFILDGATSQRIGTNPADCDTDGDSLSDVFEHEGDWRVLAFGDESARVVMSDPLVPDTDLDGLDDGEEFRGADMIDYGLPGDSGDATDPSDPDTDGDNRIDGDEINANTNPLLPDIAVEVKVTTFDDVAHADEVVDDWDFTIKVRRPAQGITELLMDDQAFITHPSVNGIEGSSNGDNACGVNWWQTPDGINAAFFEFVPEVTFPAASPTAKNPRSFGLRIQDQIVIEIFWGEFDGCNGALQTYGCIMTTSETITGETLSQMGSFVTKTYILTDTAPDCSATVVIEIRVE